MKTITRKCFQKNANTLNKKRLLDILRKTWKIFLILMNFMKNKLELGICKKDRLV